MKNLILLFFLIPVVVFSKDSSIWFSRKKDVGQCLKKVEFAESEKRALSKANSWFENKSCHEVELTYITNNLVGNLYKRMFYFTGRILALYPYMGSNCRLQ